MIRAVIFDLDGTLVDTMGDFADLAAQLIAARHGWPFAKGRQAYLDTSGIPFGQQLALLFPGDPGNDALEEAFERSKLRAYEGRGLLPDVPPALAALRERSVACVVSSNNREGVVRDFLASQPARFELVLGWREGFAKGEAHFAEVSRALGVTREEMLFVGDSVRDGELARDAGVRFAVRLGTIPAAHFAALGPQLLIPEGELGAVLALLA